MRTVGVLLAAGNSTRFGADKLDYPLPSGMSIGLASATNLAAAVDHCVAVVRRTDTALQSSLQGLGFAIVVQSDPAAGMGDNLARAIRVTQDADGWLIALADMPWIRPDTMSQVRLALQKGAAIAAPVYNRQRGHPVGFRQSFASELMRLTGDVGARHLLKRHAQDIVQVVVDDPAILLDVDHPQDLADND